ncbi:armadillo/beta-catenin/plakoglobin [Flagelloscypha sp. PMI_526]|nr:armadillo/beta-catenin/plakoglobin [Flagelloscypha sp. PMI_526]
MTSPLPPPTTLTRSSDSLFTNSSASVKPKTLSAQSKNTVLVSHGRQNGQRLGDAFVIGIAGGSASGKTFVARQIIQSLGSIPSVVILSQDSFYKRHTPEELELAFKSLYDFDHPDSLDMPLFAQCLRELKAGQQTNVPIYSFTEHQRLPETKYLYGATIVIAEGIMALHDPELRSLYDLKVFVQCDSDIMLARRIKRDVTERGRDVNGILEQYLRYVKPAYDTFVRPSAANADIIVPGHNNNVAIELIVTHIRRKLTERINHFRPKLAVPKSISVPKSIEDLNLIVLPSTPQVKGIFTILRDETTSREDFIFFLDRLATKLIDYSLCCLPYVPCTVTTAAESVCKGKKFGTSLICGVSVLRSGGALERGLKRCINDIPVGSMLVQSAQTGGEPMLLHLNLPMCIRERQTASEAWVLMLDAQIGTGAAAMMAIRTLLDHGVREERIVFVVLLVARGGGIQILRSAFPKVKIVCGEVDGVMKEQWIEVLNEDGGHSSEEGEVKKRKVWAMQPGMGQIGDRYYL